MVRSCPKCGYNVALGQTTCERCTTYIPDYDQRRMAEALVTEKTVHSERQASSTRVRALEEVHHVNAVHGTIFWLIVFVVCVGLSALAAIAYNSQLYP